MASNRVLDRAKNNKWDEFYTLLHDIHKELVNYKDLFKDKIIYCNCDNPKISNFWKYLCKTFHFYGLKELVSTHFNADGNSYVLSYNGGEQEDKASYKYHKLQGSGDFGSQECLDLLKRADIVLTNPPFSLFRDFLDILFEYNKKFLIVGHMNAITYKKLFKRFMNNELWLGYNNLNFFKVPDHYITDFQKRTDQGYKIKNGQKFFEMGNIVWYTNLASKKKNERLPLTREYIPFMYSKFDNFDAINCDKIKDIPRDYTGLMAVPTTFLLKYNPNQFEIIGISGSEQIGSLFIKGKEIFTRVIIKKR